ncbi:unnamed protein product [marine sediment metagenome]|uniref:Uncharacterized protein n=1 Tax=marine sediment metagenome TaxID=412755 RepID=X0VN70_9ZZZZ
MDNCEACAICDGLTGRAGRADDSLYGTATATIPEWNMKEGEEIGPLCEKCYGAICRLGVADE